MELNYKKFGEQGAHLIILHGLFGSLDNWQSIARQLSEEYQVWILDQRNHGRSPHSEEMNYLVLADDLLAFMAAHQIPKAHVLGHSMGGKVAMTFALLYPGKVDHLVVADIGPVPYDGDHLPLFEAMLAMPLDQLKDRQEAEDFLENRIYSAAVRQFLLKNLARNADGFAWRPNLKVLHKHYRQLMDFDAFGKVNGGPVSFLRGAKSDYINPADFSFYQSIFPFAVLYNIPDAGHWLHAEQPGLFLEIVRTVLRDETPDSKYLIE
jgi:esterase